MKEDVTLLHSCTLNLGMAMVILTLPIVMVLAWPNRQEEVNLAVHCFSIQSLINHSSTRISDNCLRNSNTVIMY